MFFPFLGKNFESGYPILLVAHGNYITLIPIQSIETSDSPTNNFTIKAHFISDYEIIYCSWISTHLVFFLDSKKNAHVIYSGDFEGGGLTEKNSRNIENNKATLNQQKIDSELAFQTFIKDKNERQRPFFQNTVVSNPESGMVYMIGYRQILLGRMYKWYIHLFYLYL